MMPNPAGVPLFVLRAARSHGVTLAGFRSLPYVERVAWCVMAEWDEFETGIREWLGKRAQTDRAVP